MRPELIKFFVDVLETESLPSKTLKGVDMKWTLNSFKTYILRGFHNMITTSNGHYIKMLKKSGQAERLLTYFVKVSGSSNATETPVYSHRWLELSLARKLALF